WRSRKSAKVTSSIGQPVGVADGRAHAVDQGAGASTRRRAAVKIRPPIVAGVASVVDGALLGPAIPLVAAVPLAAASDVDPDADGVPPVPVYAVVGKGV